MTEAVRVSIIDPANFSPQYTSNLAQALGRLGARTTLYTSHPLFGHLAEAEGYSVELPFYRHVSGWRRLREWSRKRHRWRAVLKAASYPVGLLRLQRLLVGEPGILHYQWALAPLLDCRLAAGLRRRGWRTVATAHDLFEEQSLWRFQRAHYQTFYRSMDAVVVHTGELAGEAVRLGVQPDRVHVIARGDLGRFKGEALSKAEARARLRIATDGPLCLFFGLIKPNKGLHILLEALAAVDHPAVRLLVAGQPMEPMDRYHELARSLHLQDRIEWRLGYVPDDMVGLYFQACDLVVLPHTAISLSGVASVALGYGTPIVGTRLGGLPDLLREGEEGYLVEPGSTGALAMALTKAVRDLEGTAEMGRGAAARFAARASWETAAAKSLALYRQLFAGPPQAGA
ncbi:MAG: glycosyltransferase family 4 protein [Bryobacterales bacterium]|nr:glycosyltransferase family 4 protein [Bryobacterales bacterium]